jgi:predicted NUDIX family NTP pyrophosphohydrolase
MVTTAGLLMYRVNPLMVFLVRPSGPEELEEKSFWSIPKGHQELGEDLLDTAKREFNEEVGFNPILPQQYYDLNRVLLKPGKELWVWAFEGDTPNDWTLCSNTYQVDGIEYPEVIEAKFFDVMEIDGILEKSQIEFIRRLQNILYSNSTKLNKVKTFNEMFKK